MPVKVGLLDAYDLMRDRSRSNQAKQDIKTRQHLMERSFARATRYGFDRARWRGLSKVAIQEYLVCSIQNIGVLIRYGRNRTKHMAQAIKQVRYSITKASSTFIVKNIPYLKPLIQNFKYKKLKLFLKNNLLRKLVFVYH